MRTDISKALHFKEELDKAGFETVVSVSKGQDIVGACGQMTGDKMEE